MLKQYSKYPFNPLVEKITDLVCNKTQNDNPDFFRMAINYHLVKMPSMMRVDINTLERGVIPINIYCINLGPSGIGKGYCTNIMEEQVMSRFRSAFFEQTLPQIEEENLARIAIRRADIKGTDPEDEAKRVSAECKSLGHLLFAFDSATMAAIKQCRDKLLYTGIGSINLEMDEAGRNMSGNQEALTTMLELYDKGKAKRKLTKNTAENKHTEDMDGCTPANFVMYGAPIALFDGGPVEEAFYAYIGTGGARRSFFAFCTHAYRRGKRSAEEVLAAQLDPGNDLFLDGLAARFESLAHPLNYKKQIGISHDLTIELLEYKMFCEDEAAKLPDHEEIVKAEMVHRYFKALKLAGAYAFIDECTEIEQHHLHYAIRMAEESGLAYQRIKNRDPLYVKLAKFIADVGYELTYAQIAENLPFFKGSKTAREEMLTYAVAWGYKNNVVIRKSYSNGIDFFQGETLKATNLDKMRVAFSQHVAFDYKTVEAPFDRLYELTQTAGMHWVNHGCAGGHRAEEHVVPGFNMIVIDVDGESTIPFVQDLLKDYKGLIYTTKRHTPQEHRFRLVLPINYYLKLNQADYKEFMNNILEWLPFKVDRASAERSHKWMSHAGYFKYLPGEKLVDAMEFIPRTSRNDQRKKELSEQSLTNIERWFIHNTSDGNRSNQLIKYALMLVDQGKDFDEVRSAVYGLNSKLQDRLSENEIKQTILVSASKALKKRNP